jgi:hypothetical protein
MSLPYGFGTSLDTIPAQIPYLRPDPSLVAKWSERIGAGGFTIGISWQGNKFFNLQRSIPLACFAPLAAITGVLKFPHGEEARHYNPLQKLTYLGVIGVLLPLMILTGLTMCAISGSGRGSKWLGRNNVLATIVGVIAVPMMAATKVEYWLLSMIPCDRPNRDAIVPKVSPVDIRRVVYIASLFGERRASLLEERQRIWSRF